jgi:serine/threonine-protein kinase RsbW
MELSFPSELGYEVVARDAIAAYARYTGFDRDRIEDLKTALSEACINAIEHGNMLTPGLRVYVHCQDKGGYLQIDIRDQGVKDYVANTKPLTIAEKMAGLGPLRGMGLMLITELADKAEFVAVPKGNCFRLTFYRQPSTISRESSV